MAQEYWERGTVAGHALGLWNSFFGFVGEFVTLLGASARSAVGGVREWRETLGQMAFIGVNSVPIVFVTAAFSGAVLSLYTAAVLIRYGAGSLTGGAIGLAVTRELGPVLAGIMVSARCGSAIAAQIASMKVSEQIDALRALAVSPISYLVVPRLLAAALMLPVLGLIADYAGVFGGLGVATMLGVEPEAFLNSIRAFVVPFDVVGGLIKTLAFGVIVAIVGCQQGLATDQGAVGVGRATTNSVVISMVLIYISNYFLAWALFQRGG